MFTGCNDVDTVANESLAEKLNINGGSEVYDIANVEHSSWRIVDCPEWITPISVAGTTADDIRLYVESNSRKPLRTGQVTIVYNSGVTRAVEVAQSNEQPFNNMDRNNAVGWGFDVRTYKDSRGLRDQIFNIKKLENEFPDITIIASDTSTLQRGELMRGSSSSELSNNIQASLNLNIKYNAFSLDLKGNFGMSTLNNTSHSFF